MRGIRRCLQGGGGAVRKKSYKSRPFLTQSSHNNETFVHTAKLQQLTHYELTFVAFQLFGIVFGKILSPQQLIVPLGLVVFEAKFLSQFSAANLDRDLNNQ